MNKINTNEFKDKVRKRIDESHGASQEKDKLKQDLEVFLQDKTSYEVVDKYFTTNNLKNKEGKIVRKKLNASQSRAQTLDLEKDLDIIVAIKNGIKKKNIRLKKTIIQEQMYNHADINNLTKEDIASNDKITKFNYSDFLEGKLKLHVRPKITMIVAYDDNYGIGLDGKLPWHIPEDLKWFKENTTGKPVIMGRKNFEDISRLTKGKGLPNRANIVLSRTEQHVDNFDFHTSVESILNKYKNEKEIVIIGGTMLYETFMPIADEIIVTEIKGDWKTDTKFPQFKDKFICLKTVAQPTENAGEIYFRRFVRLEVPLPNGVAHINGKDVKYDYSNTGYFDPTMVINDVTINLAYHSPEFLSSIGELAANSPLPNEVFHSLIQYGEVIQNTGESIFSFMPDFFATNIADGADALKDFFDFSNIDFSIDFDIGDILSAFFDGIGDIISAIFSAF